MARRASPYTQLRKLQYNHACSPSPIFPLKDSVWASHAERQRETTRERAREKEAPTVQKQYTWPDSRCRKPERGVYMLILSLDFTPPNLSRSVSQSFNLRRADLSLHFSHGAPCRGLTDRFLQTLMERWVVAHKVGAPAFIYRWLGRPVDVLFVDLERGYGEFDQCSKSQRHPAFSTSQHGIPDWVFVRAWIEGHLRQVLPFHLRVQLRLCSHCVNGHWIYT